MTVVICVTAAAELGCVGGTRCISRRGWLMADGSAAPSVSWLILHLHVLDVWL